MSRPITIALIMNTIGSSFKVNDCRFLGRRSGENFTLAVPKFFSFFQGIKKDPPRRSFLFFSKTNVILFLIDCLRRFMGQLGSIVIWSFQWFSEFSPFCFLAMHLQFPIISFTPSTFFCFLFISPLLPFFFKTLPFLRSQVHQFGLPGWTSPPEAGGTGTETAK